MDRAKVDREFAAALRETITDPDELAKFDAYIAARRFEPADRNYYFEVKKRNADMRIPRDGETPDMISMYEWNGSEQAMRRKERYFERDNVHLVDVPVGMLRISERDLDPKRLERLNNPSPYSSDPIMVHLDHVSGDVVLTVDDGNNRRTKP